MDDGERVITMSRGCPEEIGLCDSAECPTLPTPYVSILQSTLGTPQQNANIPVKQKALRIQVTSVQREMGLISEAASEKLQQQFNRMCRDRRCAMTLVEHNMMSASSKK